MKKYAQCTVGGVKNVHLDYHLTKSAHQSSPRDSTTLTPPGSSAHQVCLSLGSAKILSDRLAHGYCECNIFGKHCELERNLMSVQILCRNIFVRISRAYEASNVHVEILSSDNFVK